MYFVYIFAHFQTKGPAERATDDTSSQDICTSFWVPQHNSEIFRNFIQKNIQRVDEAEVGLGSDNIVP